MTVAQNAKGGKCIGRNDMYPIEREKFPDVFSLENSTSESQW